MPTNGAPALSVIVTIVDGGEALVRCLDALLVQTDAPSLEILVPYDNTVADVAALAKAYPAFRFIDLGALSSHPPKNEYERHTLYDRRRSGGLLVARAGLLAMIEDRGPPKPDWARAMVDAHNRHADGVIGGAVESAAQGAWRWAIYFLDFGRYQAPFDSPHPEYVTDTNICYKREALERVRGLWSTMYQESVVNWALREKGVGLRLDPGPRTVQQRTPIGLAAMAMERIHWGMIYGRVRVRGRSWVDRLRWAAITPLLTPLLYVRNLRRQVRLKRYRLEFAKATVPMLYLLAFWSLGEMLGYVTADRDRT